MSPELCKALEIKDIKYIYDVYKNNIFSLGIILL